MHNQWLVINRKAISQKRGNQPDYQSFNLGNQPRGLNALARLFPIRPFVANHHFHRLIRPIIFSSRKMVLYTASKPPSAVNPEWIFWSKNDLGQSITPKQVSSLVLSPGRRRFACSISLPPSSTTGMN
jgi:hypothetical protein